MPLRNWRCIDPLSTQLLRYQSSRALVDTLHAGACGTQGSQNHRNRASACRVAVARPSRQYAQVEQVLASAEGLHCSGHGRVEVSKLLLCALFHA